MTLLQAEKQTQPSGNKSWIMINDHGETWTMLDVLICLSIGPVFFFHALLDVPQSLSLFNPFPWELW